MVSEAFVVGNMEVGERPALSSGLQGSLPLPAEAAIALLHIKVKMVFVRFIGSGSQHSALEPFLRCALQWRLRRRHATQPWRGKNHDQARRSHIGLI